MLKTLRKFIDKDNQIIVKNCLEYINKNANRHYDYVVHEYAKGWLQPSKVLSESCGIKLHTVWQLPNGWKFADFELLVFTLKNDDNLGRLLLAKIIELNYELIPLLKLKQAQFPSEVLFGVSSMFNFDDMYEYLDGGYYAYKRLDEEWNTQLEKL